MPDQYDSPWKEILEHLFRLVLALFLPEAHDDIDWSRGWQSLDKDLKKLLPDAAASNRWADKLMRVYRRSGAEQLVYLHVEVQGDRDASFPLRMFTTNYRIFDKYQKPVVSLAILGDESLSWKPESYGWDLWGCKMGIEFPVVKLWEYNERWDELESAAVDNPVAMVAMAHLRTKATRKDPQGRYREKYQLIKRLYKSGYTRQQIVVVLRSIDWLMALPKALETQLSQEIEPLDVEKKMQYVTSWERMGIEKGREEGLLRGKATVLKRLIDRRFGEVPEWAEQRMEGATSEELDLWIDRVLDAERLADIFGE